MWRNADVLDFVGWLRAHNDALRPARAGRLLRPRPLQPLRVDRGRDRATSTSVDPAAAARARAALRLLRPLRRRERRPTATPSLLGISEPCRRRGRRAARRAAAQRRRLPAARRARGRGRVVLRRAERAPGRRTPRSTTARCSAAARRPGTCATATWPTRSTGSLAHLDRHGGDRARHRVGAQLARRRRARTEMSAARRAQPRSARPRSATPATSSSSASRPTTARSPPPRTGTSRPSASACDPRCPAATRRCSTHAGSRASCCARWPPAPAARAARAAPASARSASSTGPRPSAQSHYFAAALADQFDAVIHIDETRAVEPLERTAAGSAASRPRPTPRAVKARSPCQARS